MEFFKNIGKAFSGAVSYVGEKNRRAAYLNRIRTVIRCEEKAAEKEYLALGRYYYNNLRDKSNPVTEAHCAEVEAIEGRMDKAINQLEQFYNQEQNDGVAVTVDNEKDENAPSPDGQVEVTCGVDGPTAVYRTGGGSVVEKVTLDDVEEYDHDPMADPVPAAPVAPAEPGENDGLPFEG